MTTFKHGWKKTIAGAIVGTLFPFSLLFFGWITNGPEVWFPVWGAFVIGGFWAGLTAGYVVDLCEGDYYE